MKIQQKPQPKKMSKLKKLKVKDGLKIKEKKIKNKSPLKLKHAKGSKRGNIEGFRIQAADSSTVMKKSSASNGTVKMKKGIKKNKLIVNKSKESFLTDSDSNEDEEELFQKKVAVKKVHQSKKELAGSDTENGGSGDEMSGEESDEQVISKHKKQLQNLKKSDPEFYNFLHENDRKLLQFDVSDEEDEEKDEDDKIHKLPDKLEVASDESDYEPEDNEKGDTYTGTGSLVTLKLVSKWQEDLQTDKTVTTMMNVVDAFHAALVSISEEKDSLSKYVVKSSAVFNAVLQVCVLHLPPALKKYLQLQTGAHVRPTKCKKWSKVKSFLRSYVSNLVELLSGVSSENILTVLLKHIHQMIPYITCFMHLTKKISKKLILLWSSSEDTVRVLAFLCIVRISRLHKPVLVTCLKAMYISYVRNSKFVSPSTLPMINFMRKSLVEMYILDDSVSYELVFLYIRQLAINLRNAVTLRKKESFQTVYNWQFVNSLNLWSDLLSNVDSKSPLHSLLYPLVQITIGTVKLISTAQYFPLRFHCLKFLIILSRDAGVFIPILPFLLEILSSFDFNRKHKKVSMKPHDFTFILRCPKSQMQENGYKDAVIENVYILFMEYLSIEAHRISFPDTIIPTVIQLKQFLKTCKASNYCKKMKTILDKIEENRKFIEGERRKVTLSLNDVKAVQAWETEMKIRGTPFMKYYENWKTIHLQLQAKKMTKNEEVGDYNLPVLYKFAKKRERQEKETEVPVLFPSDDEDDEEGGDIMKDDEDTKVVEKEVAERKAKRRKKERKKVKQDLTDEDLNKKDIVQDLNLSDFE